MPGRVVDTSDGGDVVSLNTGGERLVQRVAARVDRVSGVCPSAPFAVPDAFTVAPCLTSNETDPAVPTQSFFSWT